MDKATRNRLKDLLLGLPFWDQERNRRAFVADALFGHPIARSFVAEGEPALVAGELVDLCAGYDEPTEDGIAPLCALLAEIREQGLAGGARAALVADLSRTLGCEARKPSWRHDPYPGLLALDHWQAPIFFGRTTDTRKLLRLLAGEQGRRLLLVTGMSGSGKSSVVRAGVWAALTGGGVPDLPQSGDWLITAMFPAELRQDGGSADPFLALTNSLRQHPQLGWLYPGQEAERLKADPAAFADLLGRILTALPTGAEWLLVLDQLEELFTPACATLREPFLDCVLAALDLPRFRVIATVRSDFLGQCMNTGLLAEMNNGAQYGVRAPGPLAMARMIAGPVEALELAHPVDLDPDLVLRMVDDAVSEPGGLALLAFALKDLYDQCRDSGRMDLAVYESAAFGGLKGVIQRRADRALERAGDDARDALPRVFTRLLTVQPDGTATRRREYHRVWADDAPAERLIDALMQKDTRLLVAAGQGKDATLEVAHEALLREWPTLTEWIEDCREALRLRDRVVEETRTWVAQDRPTIRLWKHELLDPARRLLREAGLLDDLEQDPDTAEFLTPEPDWLLAELLCSTTDHPRRETIGMRLSEIGDPRPGVGVVDGVPDILWCPTPGPMPAGEVEIEGHGRFEVHPFHISAYPVTYAQYQAFVDAEDGYRSPRWWDGLEHEDEPGRQLRPYASYPADYVSWFDATAFCRWLSARLDVEVRLPDEWEWQWAAQSAQRDFVYPWGADWKEGVANTGEAGIGRTTAVGMYPKGRSAQGVYDLAGNVWEWCRNLHADPRKVAHDADVSRVLRGGSWYGGQLGARADYRRVGHPYRRGGYLGFRVLCGSPIR